MHTISHPILFFDGKCNLCNKTVQFIIRHDNKRLFHFAPLQSVAGQKVLDHFNGRTPDSVILYYNNTYYIKSRAALQVFKFLGGFWRLLYIGIIIPPFIRDGMYNVIARNRYKWFGKRAECMVPTPDLASRFMS